MKRRILFIGNSFTNRNDLPGMISQLAIAADKTCQIETERSIANGAALKTHWDRGAARELIRKAVWDFVVLQEQSTLPLKNRQRMHEYVTLFNDEIMQHGGKTALYLTWARRDTFERQDELSDAYLTIGRKLGAVVVPVGVALQRVLEGHPDIELHDRDKSHPNAAGSYLAACVFVATLLGINPVGLPADIAALRKLPESTARVLQEMAWHTSKPFRTT